MRASIQTDGRLFLIPESSTEQFAIQQWIVGNDRAAASYPIGFTQFIEDEDADAEEGD